MATNTTNFSLVKPAYTDTADIADINGNMDKVDVSLNGLADAIAIVANNNTHAAITAGQYVYVHGHSTLAEGLYKANSNIAANATLTSSNLTADSSGGLNALNSNFSTISLGDGITTISALQTGIETALSPYVISEGTRVHYLFFKCTASPFDSIGLWTYAIIYLGNSLNFYTGYCVDTAGDFYSIKNWGTGLVVQKLALNSNIATKSITVTKGSGINTIEITAKRTANIVSLSGYILVPAGTYGPSTPLITLGSDHPDYNVYLSDNIGRTMRCTGTGDIIYHASTELTSDEYIFLSFTYVIGG